MYQDKLLFQTETVKMLGGEYEPVMPDHGYLSAQRKAMGLSQQMVATAAGIDLRQYQRLESGERSMSSASLRIGLAICDVLELDHHRFVPTRPHVHTDTADGCRYVSIEKRPDQRTKKYMVFRSLGKVEEAVRKHELVAVEYGKDIHAVTDKLVKAVNEEATSLPQYQAGFTSMTEGPEEIGSARHASRYQYVMTAVIQPAYGDKNDLLEYVIVETGLHPSEV